MEEKKTILIEDLPNTRGYRLTVPRGTTTLSIGVTIEGTPEHHRSVSLTCNFEPKILDYYITDQNDTRIEEYRTGDKIVLNILTKNHIGDLLDLSLEDKKHDFIYNDIVLENDTLSDYEIKSRENSSGSNQSTRLGRWQGQHLP